MAASEPVDTASQRETSLSEPVGTASRPETAPTRVRIPFDPALSLYLARERVCPGRPNGRRGADAAFVGVIPTVLRGITSRPAGLTAYFHSNDSFLCRGEYVYGVPTDWGTDRVTRDVIPTVWERHQGERSVQHGLVSRFGLRSLGRQ